MAKNSFMPGTSCMGQCLYDINFQQISLFVVSVEKDI